MTTDPDAVIRNAQRILAAREYPTGEVWTDLLAVAEEQRIRLAAAQAQLAEARASATAMHDIGIDVVRERDGLRARLEAVRALRGSLQPDDTIETDWVVRQLDLILRRE
jgi:hypothetical protein